MSITNEPIVRIKIVGIGGGGKNAVERMLETNIPMVSYVSIVTDDKAYASSHAEIKLQIGNKQCKGYGAGSDPEIGFLSAQENRKEIENVIKGCDMLFIVCGMGGGTGSGASPVVADIAKKLGILTVAVVTTPFGFEGRKRMGTALDGIKKLRESIDSIIVISNDKLRHVSEKKITFKNAFSIADDILVQMVKSLVEIIQNTAFINCDFADICSVLSNSGDLFTATSLTAGDNRVEDAIDQIQSNVLLESSANGALGVMLCITASNDIGLEEIDKISSAVSDLASPNANFIFGINFNNAMDNTIKVVLLATKKI